MSDVGESDAFRGPVADFAGVPKRLLEELLCLIESPLLRKDVADSDQWDPAAVSQRAEEMADC